MKDLKNSEKLLDFWIREIMEAGMRWLFNPIGSIAGWITLDTSSLPTDVWASFSFVDDSPPEATVWNISSDISDRMWVFEP